MAMGSFRHANIGIGVGMAIVVGGVIAFKDSSEAAMQAVAMVGFFSAFVVFHYLDERAKRRDRKRSQ
jgi:hypothetical protein